MVTLIITHADDSPYWKEYFDTLPACNAWLSEERTRPYWKQDFKIQIIDTTADEAVKEQQRKDQLKQESDARLQLINDIKALKQKKGKSLSDISDMLDKITQALGV